MGSEEQGKAANVTTRQTKVMFALFVALAIVSSSAFFTKTCVTEELKDVNPVQVNLPSTEDTKASKVEAGGASSGETKLELSPFEKCSTYQPTLQDESTFTTKPLWLPMFPSTIPEELHKTLINPLTKTRAGGKSFYVSIKGRLRHCIGVTQSVTCSIINAEKNVIDAKAQNYDSKYIMAIRNPMTAIPAFDNAKSIQYHGTVGQVIEDNWRSTRDTWFKESFTNWMNNIKTWQDSQYELGMYLVYEDLMDTARGPEMMKRLRTLLSAEGFNVADEEDVACIWYNAVGKEQLERYHRLHYEYEDYIPGYTTAQKEAMLKELDDLMKEYKSDVALVDILSRYKSDVEENMRIDQEASQS